MALHVVVVLIISVITQVVADEKKEVKPLCEAPWLMYAGNCYYFHNVTTTLRGHTWSDAQMICEGFGGNLVSITNKNESDFISAMFQNKWVKRSQYYWIGLNDEEGRKRKKTVKKEKRERKFVWTDGSPFGTVDNKTAFSNWRASKGEPNNYGGMEVRYEHFVPFKWSF